MARLLCFHNLGRSLRIRVMKAFVALVSFVITVYLSELMVSRIITSYSAEIWLRLGWVGIAMVPRSVPSFRRPFGEYRPAEASRYRVAAGSISGIVFLALVCSPTLGGGRRRRRPSPRPI
ncbi:MAG: hypothetical protein M5U34_23825 [Chloroflexi bacterium]|nr:hypothetical protein [Chloroflexota bacterium]